MYGWCILPFLCFFAPNEVGGHGLGTFVTKPFKSWIIMSEKANAHAKHDYHLMSMAKISEFLDQHRNPAVTITAIVDKEKHKVMENNKRVIESLFKIVLLCGKQGIALCGHRDDDIKWMEPESHNEGNFIALVRLRAETDNILAEHLAHSPRNARYTSKSIQNELVSIIGNKICCDIVDEVKMAKFYSVIADEVTDVANKEVLSLVLRYVLDGLVKEAFVDFLAVERITGEVLAHTLMQWLRLHGLHLENMRGQCYDGASNMAGARAGCRAVVQREAPMALYFHCAAHRLNLAVVSACRLQAFKNAESCVGEIARFFNFSAKRQRLLDKAIDKSESITKSKLKDACRTRWVERIDSYVVFLELLPAVHTTLEAIVHPNIHQELGISWNWDGETITKANGFLFQLQSPTFLICFKILLQVLYILRELTVKLQMQASDVVSAYQQVDTVVCVLKCMRQESVTEFKKIFGNTTKLEQELHGGNFILQKPRIASRQQHRSNPDITIPEDYFRVTLYDEFLSHVVAELEDRFVNNPTHTIVQGLFYLLPSQCVNVHNDGDLPAELNQAVEFYKHDLPHSVMFPTEYGMWIRKWKADHRPPEKLVDTIQACSKIQFPNLYTLLHIALTVPITSCESERSFSQLKVIKDSHRSTMSDHRLSGLSLMKINRDRCTQLSSTENLRELVKLFVQLHPRRMKLSFMLVE